MKVGIVQPYFFPYLGYWQLINAVDKYVIFDDVNYIKRGWINRNRILNDGSIQYLNVYLKAVSQNKLINDIEVDCEGSATKDLQIIRNAYCKAPYFDTAFPVIECILKQSEHNLARYNGNAIKIILDYLNVDTELLYSSEIAKDNSLRGQEKIMSICESLGATEYVNAIGGQELYNSAFFAQKGMKLFFLKTDDIRYKQFGDVFYEDLSIIDVMMFNSRDTIIDYLGQYTLIEGKNV